MVRATVRSIRLDRWCEGDSLNEGMMDTAEMLELAAEHGPRQSRISDLSV